MSRALKILFSMLTITALSGCGGWELFLLGKGGPRIKVPSPDFGISRLITEMMARGLGCALQAGFSEFGPRLAIEFEHVEFNFVGEEIRTKKIVDPNLFWAQLDAAESTRLRALVTEAYDALAADSVVRLRPVEFYRDLLAMGLMNAVKDNVQVGRLLFARHILVSRNPDRYESYRLGVKLRHAGTLESKAYATCE